MPPVSSSSVSPVPATSPVGDVLPEEFVAYVQCARRGGKFMQFLHSILLDPSAPEEKRVKASKTILTCQHVEDVTRTRVEKALKTMERTGCNCHDVIHKAFDCKYYDILPPFPDANVCRLSHRSFKDNSRLCAIRFVFDDDEEIVHVTRKSLEFIATYYFYSHLSRFVTETTEPESVVFERLRALDATISGVVAAKRT